MFEIDPSLKAVDFRALEDWMKRKRSWVNTRATRARARTSPTGTPPARRVSASLRAVEAAPW